jgi:hypothetical protein
VRSGSVHMHVMSLVKKGVDQLHHPTFWAAAATHKVQRTWLLPGLGEDSTWMHTAMRSRLLSARGGGGGGVGKLICL